jgi:putative hemolysin
MEQVRKDHYSAFCKHLLVCDLSLGVDFLKEIQVHYDMNSKLEMLIKKL